jgi:hypothetical protein
MTFGWGRFPDLPAAVAIYKQLGLKGHNGQDYASPTGAKCYAITKAVVKHAGFKAGGYGICVILEFTWIDGRRYEAVYAHLQSVAVSAGQVVEEGQVLGYTNNTGSSAGPHLHFAIRPVGANQNDGYYGYIDPEPFFTAQGAPEDMTWEDYVRNAYAVFQKDNKPSPDTVRAHAAHLATLDAAGVADWTRRFAEDGRWVDWPEHNAAALTSYAAATGRGDGNPRQWAVERVNGGDSFDAIIHRDSAASRQHEQELEQRLAAQEEEIRTLHTALEKTEVPDDPQEPADAPAEGPGSDLSADEVGFIKRLKLFFDNALMGR